MSLAPFRERTRYSIPGLNQFPPIPSRLDPLTRGYHSLSRGPPYRNLSLGQLIAGRYIDPLSPIRRGYSRDLLDPIRSRQGHRDIDLHGLGLARRPMYRYPFYDDPFYDNCDICRSERESCHQDSCHQGGRCSCSHSCCDKANSSSKEEFDLKTKDITIRGKARPIRASYLTEASKFEADLTKYLEKKKEDTIPDAVIDMLFSFINREQYTNNSLIDEVTLNILAHNVGAKSAAAYSLDRLKKYNLEVGGQELTNIIASVVISSKVDSGLKEWLKKYLKNDDRFLHLRRTSRYWWSMVDGRPEVEMETLRLLGEIPEASDEGIRIL
jgi:hypothetical protein